MATEASPLVMPVGYKWPAATVASCVCATALLFASTATGVKLTGLSTMEVVLIPSILCTFATGLLAFASGGSILPSNSVAGLVATRSLLNCSAIFCYYFAAQYLPFGAALSVFFTYTVLVVFMEDSLSEFKGDRTAWLGSVLMLAGISMFGQTPGAFESDAALIGFAATHGVLPQPPAAQDSVQTIAPLLFGVGLALAGAGCAAASFICLRVIGQRASALQMTFSHFFAVSLYSALVMLAGIPHSPNWAATFAIWPALVLAATSQLLGQLVYSYTLQQCTASKAVAIVACQVLCTYFLNVVLFQQPISLLGMLGGQLIMLGTYSALCPGSVSSVMASSQGVSWLLETISASSEPCTGRERTTMQCCGASCCHKAATTKAELKTPASIFARVAPPEDVCADYISGLQAAAKESKPPTTSTQTSSQPRVSFAINSSEVTASEGTKSYGQLNFSIKQVPEQEDTATLCSGLPSSGRPSMLDIPSLLQTEGPKLAADYDDSEDPEALVAFRACSSHNNWARSCPHPAITLEGTPCCARRCPDDPHAEEHPGYMRCRSHTEWQITRFLVSSEPLQIRFQTPPPPYSPRRSPQTHSPLLSPAASQSLPTADATMDSGVLATKQSNSGFQMVRKKSNVDLAAVAARAGSAGTGILATDSEERAAGWKVFRQALGEDLTPASSDAISQDLLIEQLEATPDGEQAPVELTAEHSATPNKLVCKSALVTLVIPTRSDLSMTDLAVLSPGTVAKPAHSKVTAGPLPCNGISGGGKDDGAALPEEALAHVSQHSKYCHWSVKRLTPALLDPEPGQGGGDTDPSSQPPSPHSMKYSTFRLKRISCAGSDSVPASPGAYAIPRQDSGGSATKLPSLDATHEAPLPKGVLLDSVPVLPEAYQSLVDPPKTPPSPDHPTTKATRIFSSPAAANIAKSSEENSPLISRLYSDGLLPPPTPPAAAAAAVGEAPAAKPRYKVAGPYQPWKVTRISSDGSSVDIQESRRTSTSGVQVYVNPSNSNSESGASDMMDSPPFGSPEELLLGQADVIMEAHEQAVYL